MQWADLFNGLKHWWSIDGAVVSGKWNWFNKATDWGRGVCGEGEGRPIIFFLHSFLPLHPSPLINMIWLKD